ncbi:MAG: helix-turn-helix domain-containing protein [Kineosporiaceae bacterium]
MAPAEIRTLRRVALVVDDGMSAFETAVPCEVFGIDRSAQGLPGFDFRVCSPRPGPLRSGGGFAVLPDHDLGALEGADLVVVAPTPGNGNVPHPDTVTALRAAVAAGTPVASMCSSAFILGRAGLLDGRRVATHWMHAPALQAEFPNAHVVDDVLYVEDGPILSSAGTASAIDLCLHLVRQAHGSQVATAIARRMVVPPHREGGQAQYVETPVRVSSAQGLGPVLEWAQEHLAEDLSVGVLAARAGMSTRTFARRFRAETGTTPHHWVLARRLELTERLLETTDAPVEEISRRVGFGSATVLRHHFSRHRSTSPQRYRRSFGQGRSA